MKLTRDQVNKIEELCVLAMYSMIDDGLDQQETARDAESFRARAIAMYQGRRYPEPDYESNIFHAKVKRLVAGICDLTTEGHKP